MHTTELHPLPSASLGTERVLTVHRFGTPGARPKVYIQAGIHADELAANLTAHHLAEKLSSADVVGEIILVPLANALGQSQNINRVHLGRSDLATGSNFNRSYPDVSEAVKARNPSTTQEARRFVGEELAKKKPLLEKQVLQHTLITMAHDADIVLDLHTDSDAEMHLYLDPDQWPSAKDLAHWLGARVVMLARNSGDNPLEETVAAPFIACGVEAPLTVVVELRGKADVADDLASQDADALFHFLQGRSVITGDPGTPPDCDSVAALFEHTAYAIPEVPGIIAYKKNVGDMVQTGDVVAEIVDVRKINGARTPVHAPTSGRMFARSLAKLARPGMSIATIFGTEPVKGRDKGNLLGD
ncbi:MAG: succinylglutamate desuccinylase/aspartoacylase family protein [Hyphomicrobiales bacterium]